MLDDPAFSRASFNRRAVLSRIAVAGAAVGIGSRIDAATAQDVANEMANHPLVGTWLSGTGPNDLSLVHWSADGNQDFPATIFPSKAASGTITYNDSAMGVWEPIDDRAIHITFTWATRDEIGAVIETTTVDGYPVASDDGMSFVDDGTKVVITQRDPSGAITQVTTGVPVVIGVRALPGDIGYERAHAMMAVNAVGTPKAGTPTG